jgi:signal transduction histidine kinase
MTLVGPIGNGEKERRAMLEPPCPALDLVQRLMLESEAESVDVERALEQLAAAFDAEEAGLAGINAGQVAIQMNWPLTPPCPEIDERLPAWADTLAQAWQSSSAVVAATTSGASLLIAGARVDEELGWLVWVGSDRDGPWTSAHRATLALAAAALARILTGRHGSEEVAAWLGRGRRQHRLERAARLVSRLIHDFNNVLTGVLGFTELGLAQATPGSSTHQFLTEAYQAAQQGSRLADQLALFSRRAGSRPRSTSLTSLVNEEQVRLQKEVRDGLSVLVDLPADLTPVAIDSESLRTILRHLIDNAGEAMPSGGVLAISARETDLASRDCLSLLGMARPGKHVELTVADTGPGFSHEARERILAEPFYTTKPRHRGLGLPAVYGLLCGQGGGIRLEHGRRQGAVVQVYLPASPGTRQPAEPAAISQPRGEKVAANGDPSGLVSLASAELLAEGPAGRPLNMLHKPFRPEGSLRAVRSADDQQGSRFQHAMAATGSQKRSWPESVNLIST